ILESFGIKKNWLNRWPNELSGGELQRFALARALSPKTRFLIADEISTMVDAITQAQIWNIVLNIVEELNIGVLVVSHDRDLINRVCHDTIYLKDITSV
ncbi:MAG: ATP-binding cassette domain-containing protein, partial [Methanosarcina sp.]|nr:ATP-binding cassette domain-containing protein [Methanosarcina sp.]